jgi:hypothetical protein
MTIRSYGASGVPSVQVIQARPVETVYRVSETVEPLAQVARRRSGFVQFFLEFGQALFGVVVGVTRAIVGLGMPLGVLAAIGFLILYGFIGVQSCLYWAAGSGALAFASFAFCYMTGIVQAGVERFVARGRA